MPTLDALSAIAGLQPGAGDSNEALQATIDGLPLFVAAPLSTAWPLAQPTVSALSIWITPVLLLPATSTSHPSRSRSRRAGLYSPVLTLLRRPTERIVVVRDPGLTMPPNSGGRVSLMITTRLSQEPFSGSPVSAAASWS